MEQQVQLGLREIDIEYNWHQGLEEYPDYDITTLHQFVHKFRNPVESILEKPKISLTNEQQEFIDYIRIHLPVLKQQQIRFLCYSSAGCGKSILLSELRSLCEKYNVKAKFMCPTGAASFNISAETIHHAYGIGFYPASLEAILNIRPSLNFVSRFQDVDLLVIDEYSLISRRLFNFMSVRLCQAFNSKTDFAGKSIILFGDHHQLTLFGGPVWMGYPPPETLAERNGLRLFQSFKNIHKLTKIIRQLDDKDYATLLNNIRNKVVKRENVAMLNSRCYSRLTKSEYDKFESALRLFPLNKDVNFYNISKVEELGQPVIAVRSHTVVEGFLTQLYAGPGVRVMLRRNLNIETGLCSGATGTIKHVLFCPLADPQVVDPFAITVIFDKYSGMCLSDGSVSIPKISTPIYDTASETFVTRYEFPLVMAYATTVHRAQSTTLPQIVVHLDSKERFYSQTYVALSRIKHLTDLMIHDERVTIDRFRVVSGFMSGKDCRDSEDMRLEKYHIWGEKY